MILEIQSSGKNGRKSSTDSSYQKCLSLDTQGIKNSYMKYCLDQQHNLGVQYKTQM